MCLNVKPRGAVPCLSPIEESFAPPPPTRRAVYPVAAATTPVIACVCLLQVLLSVGSVERRVVSSRGAVDDSRVSPLVDAQAPRPLAGEPAVDRDAAGGFHYEGTPTVCVRARAPVCAPACLFVWLFDC